MATFPVYRKSVCHYYKVVNSDEAIQVFKMIGKKPSQVTVVPASQAWGGLENQTSTELEFNQMYVKALENIDSKVNIEI